MTKSGFGTAGLILMMLAAGSTFVWAQRGQATHAGAINAAAPVRPTTALRSSGPNLGGRPYPLRTDLPTPTGLISPAAAYSGISPGGLRTVGRRSRYPFIPVVGYYGGLDYGYPAPNLAPVDNGYASGDQGGPDLVAAQDAMAEQIRQLSADLEHLKANSSGGAVSPYAQQPTPNASVAQVEPQQAPIQLVLRTGEQMTVKSYAVMNGILWDFSAQRVRKVPVSNVDVAASTKATEAGGGEFPQLSAQ